MTDQRELDRMLGAFLGEGADELADRVIDAALDEIDHTQQRRALRMPRRFPTMNTYSRLGAAAVIGVLAVAGTLVLVQRGQPGVGGSGAPSGASASPSQPAVPSPSPVVGVTDEALVADLAAMASNPYDAAKVAALYAPNAVLYDKVANETSTGLEAIQAKDKAMAAVGFEVKITSAWIRQDHFVAHFAKFGNTSELSGRGLVVYELKDGKVLNQWVYDAASSAATQSPAAVTDEALVADLAALMSSPYDAAKVAALYAPNAVIHETTASQTQRGLDEIGARIRYFNDQKFEAVVTSAPIRQDNFVAVFTKYGTGGDLSGRALAVYELKDGKVLNQWVYPAP